MKLIIVGVPVNTKGLTGHSIIQLQVQWQTTILMSVSMETYNLSCSRPFPNSLPYTTQTTCTYMYM